MTAELTVVMPCFNEGCAIESVLDSWNLELERSAIDYQIRVYDDGSTDATPRLLERISSENSRVTWIRQPNVGHGPTVLRGYAEATSRWIFQVDSDDALPVEGFEDLWQQRENFDFLVARRCDRDQSALRALISISSRMTVRFCFGSGLGDVNSPYRLFRRCALQRLLPAVPDSAFAPNVMLSGLALRAGLRIYQGSVSHRRRRTGRGSLTWSKLLWGSARSLVETVACASRTRGGLM